MILYDSTSLPSRYTGKDDWSIPAVASQNINSLSSTVAGGITARFAKVITLIATLLLTHSILCVQDVRVPSDDYIDCFRHTFPNHHFIASADTVSRGGVITIIDKKLFKSYDITRKTLFRGAVLSTTFHHKTKQKQFTVINTYLDASNEQNWSLQVSSLSSHNLKPNTMVIGDLNHAPDDVDRSGFHCDKSRAARDLFQNMLTKHGLQEVYQTNHTWYGCREDRLSSSRIDRAYHNFDFVTIATHRPTLHTLTTIPHTVTTYGVSNSGSDWTDDSRDFATLEDRQLISSFKLIKDGGTHITDHLPLSLRFTLIHNTTKKKKFVNHSINSSSFTKTFQDIWDANSHTGDWKTDFYDLKRTLYDTSHVVKKLPHAPPSKNTQLWEAVKLVNAIDNQDPDIHSKFTHIPDYLALANDPDKLVETVNLGFATIAYDEDTDVPISKVQTIAKMLPSSKTKLCQLYDSSTESITADPDRMTNIASNFWKDKWKFRPIKNPKHLFHAYGKRIKIQPSEITIDDVIDAINNTNDSAPGVDSIPFAAYRAVVDTAAPIFLAAIEALMQGGHPPEDFNAGILHLLPKKATDRIEDTRPLVINNTDNRIIAAIIQRKIMPSLDTILSDNQTGFRADCSTHDNIDFFNEKFYDALENKRFYDILFVDFLKAFDSISHDAIFKLLSAVGIPTNLVTIIRSLFANAHCFTNFGSANPARINFESGVKQGCPLSPTLFILIADVLIDMLEEVADVTVKLYADDTAIGSENIVPKLKAIKSCFQTFKVYTGLEMNVAKSAVVATGGRISLRVALDNVGWGSLRISGNERYLGTYIGHNTSLDDIFRPPLEKLKQKINLFNSIKNNHSIQNRVIIWNTWLLPIFSYVFNFHIIPTDYLGWVDAICSTWLNHGNVVKPLHLSRPTSLAGLTTPLRDTTLANYSLLASKAHKLNSPTDLSTTWSIRIHAHRVRARDFLQREYAINITPTDTSSKIYSNSNHSTTMTNSYTDYIHTKLNRLSVDINDTGKQAYLHNAKLAPAWLPSYVRLTNIRIANNALPTARRLHRTEKCYLCDDGTDDIYHIWGHCAAAAEAHHELWNMLATRSPFLFSTAICANTHLAAEHVGTQYMLTDSIWRARCSAWAGMLRDTTSWANWIVTNTLTRISNSATDFFSRNFTNNTVPLRYRITYKANLGSSKNNDSRTRRAANHVVTSLINSLPVGSTYAFTDGSANPNPGPTGAGAAVYDRKVSTDSISHRFAASIGHGDNNTGEIFAIGIVLEHLQNTNHKNAVHIFTDSELTAKAFNKGSGVGQFNSHIFHAARAIRRKLCCPTTIHWVPGHSDIKQNDTADELAKLGAARSADSNSNNILTNHLGEVHLHGFLAPVFHINLPLSPSHDLQ